MSVFLTFMEPRSIMETVELGSQLAALISFAMLIDTSQNALPRRLVAYEGDTARYTRRVDDLQRNALGRKRKLKAS